MTTSTQPTQSTQPVSGKPFLYVDLKTPYLTRSFEDLVRERGVIEAIGQVALAGQEEVTLNDVRRLVSPGGKIVAITARGRGIDEAPEDRLAVPDLYIAGAVREAEEEIRKFMNDGLLIARFSIFYGGPSRYTGRLPEQAGYSLDIPKSVDIVRKLLTNDNCLEAIALRNPEKIRSSLDELNKTLDAPIIATPHLEVALSLPKARRMLII